MHSLVFTQLDYCNALLVGVPKYLATKLQSIQNVAARTVLQKSKFTRVTPLLIELHWLPVEYRIKFKILLLTYKGLNHDTSPAYIKELLVIKPSQNIRSDMVLTLIVPKVKHKTLGERSFARAATAMWNDLPHHLRQCKDIERFKSSIKSYLFKLAFGR